MTKPTRSTPARWAIVVADDHGYDSGIHCGSDDRPTPVQYCQLGGKRTLFQESLQRAMRVAPASQVMVTALDAYRLYWEPSLWFMRPEHRFVSIDPGMSWLTTTAAILSIAQKSPDSIVTLFPGRCFVSHEPILTEAVDNALAMLPFVPEAVVSLGMQDLDGGIDEDYLVPQAGEHGRVLRVVGVARRPIPWISHYLRAEGALVASRITCSYARTLAAHISLVWPGLAAKLLKGTRLGSSQFIPNGIPKAMLRSRQWYPPTLPQRVLRVRSCGWSGLRTARAVALVSPFLPMQQPLRAAARTRAPASAPY